jgi:hypothetical protein
MEITYTLIYVFYICVWFIFFMKQEKKYVLKKTPFFDDYSRKILLKIDLMTTIRRDSKSLFHFMDVQRMF